VGDVVDLIKSMTDSDTIGEFEPIGEIITEIAKNSGFDWLSANLQRFDENDTTESQTIFNILGIYDNTLEVTPNLNTVIALKTNVLSWIVDRIQKAENTYHEIKL
jgi:hypothetical protein